MAAITCTGNLIAAGIHPDIHLTNDRLSLNEILHPNVSCDSAGKLYQVDVHLRRDEMSQSCQDNRWSVLKNEKITKQQDYSNDLVYKAYEK